MNALELLAELEKSGTGPEKMEQARAVAREKGTTLKAMDAGELVEDMEARQRRRLDLMAMGGERRERLALPPDVLLAWPEGTLAKARRVVDGLPAVPEGREAGSAVFDVDEPAPAGKGDEAGLRVANPLDTTPLPDGGARPAKNPVADDMAAPPAKDAPQGHGGLPAEAPGEGKAQPAAPKAPEPKAPEPRKGAAKKGDERKGGTDGGYDADAWKM